MIELSKKFGNFCLSNNLVVNTSESCTAGLIASTIAETSGSSKWLDSGFIVYTAQAKSKILGVNPETIKNFNITSMEVSSEMVWGASKISSANVFMSVTGVAGPTGGTTEIPVGTVCMSWLFILSDQIITHDQIKLFKGNRNEIRKHIVKYMLTQCMHYYEQINE